MGAHRSIRFKQADVKRAAAGAQQAGVRIGRIEIDALGKIVIIPEGSAAIAASDDSWADFK